jgi:hypothetical protein
MCLKPARKSLKKSSVPPSGIMGEEEEDGEGGDEDKRSYIHSFSFLPFLIKNYEKYQSQWN